eukprot:Skav204507  [mRNA]  locus=scaffold527:269864:275110:+ [translate_table: standard]
MGCGASTAKVMDFNDLKEGDSDRFTTFDYLDDAEMTEGDEVGRQSTLRSWTMTALPGVPLPPNRTLHQQHISKMEKFRTAVEATPLLFRCDVEWRRIVDAKLQKQQESDAK